LLNADGPGPVPLHYPRIGLPIAAFRLAAPGRVPGAQGGGEDFAAVAGGEAAIADDHCPARPDVPVPDDLTVHVIAPSTWRWQTWTVGCTAPPEQRAIPRSPG
jgi:hypothetical protein